MKLVTRYLKKKSLLKKLAALFSLFFLLFYSSIEVHAQRATGLRFTSRTEYEQIEKASIQLLKDVPSEFDLTKWFPTPGDQGQQASCVGWALAYGIKTYQEAIRLQRRPTDSSHIFSPAYIFNQINHGCSYGTNLRVALEFMRLSGVATLESFPYDENECHTLPNQDVKDEAKHHTITSWKRVEYRNEGLVKTFIASGKPIVIGMETDPWFYKLDEGEVYRVTSGRSTGGHAVVVIGYDDRRGAYKILNSWGNDWGDNGYGWIEYDLFSRIVHEAYVLEDGSVNTPINKGPRRKQKTDTGVIHVGVIPENRHP